MEVQSESGPFQIIHNARSQKGSRSRKSSVSTHGGERHPTTSKKLRKMTMNPESVNQQVIREMDQLNERPQVRSLRQDVKEQPEEQLQFWRCLQLGTTKIQSSQQMQLEKAIGHGLIPQRQLDHEFQCFGNDNNEKWAPFD